MALFTQKSIGRSATDAQCRVKQWRALHGSPKEPFFEQEHRPGEAMQTDFTSVAELGITICRDAVPHLLCHQVLPYSNWEWATVARSGNAALAVSTHIHNGEITTHQTKEVAQEVKLL